MQPNSSKFLRAVLGDDGAEALQKAAQRSEELGNALVPRTIMAWVDIAGRFGFEGEIPGVENTYVRFTKGENGYSGSIAFGDDVFSFEDASVFRLSASVAVVLGVAADDTSVIRDADVLKLGKSVDCLVKARCVAKKLAEAEDEEELEKAGGAGGGGAKGAETPGGAAAPKAPDAPQPAMPKQPKQTAPKAPKATTKVKVPKAAPSRTVKLTQSEKLVACPVCERTQFEHGVFVGCQCFRGLAKSAITTQTPTGAIVELGEDWDQDSIVTLLEALGRR